MNTMMNGRFMTIVDSVLLVGEGGLVMTGSVEGAGGISTKGELICWTGSWNNEVKRWMRTQMQSGWTFADHHNSHLRMSQRNRRLERHDLFQEKYQEVGRG